MNEYVIQAGIRVNSGNGNYSSNPNSYVTDLDGDVATGPTPGAIVVTTAGVDVDLSALTRPGPCKLHCISEDAGDDNYVDVGVKDASSGVFFPLMEVAPGKPAVFHFSRNFPDEFVGTGTPGQTNTFHMKSRSGDVHVRVEAFER